MPAVIMVPPVPMAIAADPARTVIGVDDPAVRIVGVIGRVVATMEETAVMMEMRDAIAAVMAEPAIAHAATMPAASTTEGVHASAVKATTVEATAVAATMTSATVTAAAMTATHLDQTVTDGLRR